MENEKQNTQLPGEEQAQGQGQEQEKKVTYGPLIGSEGEVSGYDWDEK